MQYICSPFVVLFCVLSLISQNGANINNFLLTFQGKKVYKKYFFFITGQDSSLAAVSTAPFARPRLHFAQRKLVNFRA